jgi:AcrR family transcriptional regulator
MAKRETKTRPPQERGTQTRRRLLEITAQTIADEGIHNLRFAHIAKAAQIPQALLGYHFPTMETLLVEVVQLELEKLKSLSVSLVEKNAEQPKKALAAYIRAPFELAKVDPSFRAVFTAFYHLSSVTPAFAEMGLIIRKVGRERIMNLITMVMATEGQLAIKTMSRDRLLELATAVQGIITGHAQMAVSEKNADYQIFSDLAVETSMTILGLD